MTQKQEKAVLKAALRWWRSHRPLEWGVRTHTQHPDVNATYTPQSKALAIACARLSKRMTFVRRLLKENGLILSGYDPGVLALEKTGRKDSLGKHIVTSLCFERAEWAWLEPKLLELRRLRKAESK